jgi:hypothetical protein
MDEIVARSLAKWPNVPAVFGWLLLDRRGNWRLRSAGASASFQPIANTALREFIARNYQPDERGRWFFQNGPQRVYAKLAYTPLVVRYEGDGAALIDHRGLAFRPSRALTDEEGSVLYAGEGTIALLDDRDLLRFADSPPALEHIPAREVPAKFGFAPDPAP